MRFLDQIKSGGFLDPATLQGAALFAVVFAFFAWLFGRALRMTVQRLLAHDKHAHLDLMAVKFLAKLTRYCVYIFAFVAYAHLVPGLSGLGSASLTSISVITVIVGLAAQNTLGNLVAGISLLLYRPFKLGDRLQVIAPTGLETGTVENLTLGYTLLKTDDNRRVVVPNSLMASQTTINLTTNDPRVVCSVPMSISYDADIDKARAILLDLGSKHPKATQVCGCPLTQLGTAGVVLSLDVWCADAFTAIALRCDLLEQAKKRFALEGIALPLPQTTVVLKDDRRIH
ncbi:MAG: mechanosensitive ion channel family protein [Verrucomicrobia bacterium]|jgi:small-conductance mechanosensitive channel|nr:mechanosensitive ion channel family protein [Verrucomicrobiota bacterium]